MSPEDAAEKIKVLNLSLTFEDALKIHLGIGQALAKLNSYDRATKAGKQTCVKLVLYLGINRLRVLEGKLWD